MAGKNVRPAKLLRLGGRAEFLPEPFGNQRVRPGEGIHLLIVSRTPEFRKLFASCMHLRLWVFKVLPTRGLTIQQLSAKLLIPGPTHIDLNPVEFRIPYTQICIGDMPPAAADFESLSAFCRNQNALRQER